MGRWAPYGFDINPKDTSKLIVNVKEAEIVNIIMKMHHSDNLGKYAITSRLNKDPELAAMSRTGHWNQKIVGKIVARTLLSSGDRWGDCKQKGERLS